MQAASHPNAMFMLGAIIGNIIIGIIVMTVHRRRHRHPEEFIKFTYLQVRDVWLEDSTDPELNYPRKLRVLIANNSIEQILIWGPHWRPNDPTLTDYGGARPISLKSIDLSNKWDKETTGSLLLERNREFQLWIPIRDTASINNVDIRQLSVSRELGRLVFSVRYADGVVREEEIQI